MFLAIQKRAALTNVKKGFTLIELIIVIVILVVLAAIGIPAVMNYVDQANKATAVANARATYGAACLLAADKVIDGTNVFTGVTGPAAVAKAGAVGTVSSFTIETNGTISVFVYTERGYTVTKNSTTGQFDAVKN